MTAEWRLIWRENMASTTIEIDGGMFDSTEITETADGFPVGNKAVSAEFFAKMIATLYGNGIVASGGTDALRVAAGSGMNLRCLPGTAWINGYMAWNREEVSLPIAAGRRYTICLRLNLQAGTYAILCAEDPEDGLYPVRNETIYDLVLAKASVPASAVEAEEAVVEDCRYRKELCGVVSSAAESLGAIAFAAESGTLGGYTADDFLQKTGGSMTGKLLAAEETTGASAVRNISYGLSVPDTLREGEIFILLS